MLHDNASNAQKKIVEEKGKDDLNFKPISQCMSMKKKALPYIL